MISSLVEATVYLSFKGSALFDFSGSGGQVPFNLNTPRHVTYSAVLYCLRCMVGHDIPLNQVFIVGYLVVSVTVLPLFVGMSEANSN